MVQEIFLMVVVQMEVQVEVLMVVVVKMKVAVVEMVVGKDYCCHFLVLAYLSYYLVYF